MQHAVILLDIEGTTTSISFVYDVLFPWVRARLHNWLAATWETPQTAEIVADLARLAADDASAGLAVPPIDLAAERDVLCAAVTANVVAQMDADRKTTALKRLQGVMWADGYARGELRGHLFDDVPEAFAQWRARGQRVCIYSSGSVAAQKLLFAYSVAGDLTPQIEAYFDTTTGPKKEAASYTAIASTLAVQPSAVVFVSDNLDELRAAEAAGVSVLLAVRPGNPAAATAEFAPVSDFRTIV